MPTLGVRLAVVLAVVLAGCGGGPAVPERPAVTPAPVPTDRPTPTADGDGGAVRFAFARTGIYVFDVSRLGRSGQLVLAVTEATEGSVAVAVTLELGDDRFGTSVNGTRRRVERTLAATRVGSVVAGVVFRPTRMYYDGGSRADRSPRPAATVTVAGEGLYADTECDRYYASGIRGCYAPEVGMAPYVFYLTEDGTVVLEATLVERHQITEN